MAVKEGWRGRFFEDFEIGDIYEHPLGRTVTTTDNAWFTLLTQNTAAIHFDHHYASQTGFGRPLVDSTFTLALVTGQSVSDVSQNVFVNLGWDAVKLPNPVFEGDTIYSQSEVLEKRESNSRPDVGIVRVKTTGFNQDGTTVITFMRTVMVYTSIPYETLHIATERKSVYELARRRSQSVRPGSRKDSKVSLPEDISLDTRLWRTLKEQLSKGRPPASASIG